MTAEIRTSEESGVLHIQIDRPQKKNALTVAMYVELTEALVRAREEQTIRAVLLSGVRDAFTAGNDLGDFLTQPPTGDDSPVMAFLRTLATFEKPLVAAVNGVAIGIGTTLLLHCDLAYAGTDARFQLPFVNLGLVPEAGSSYLLPRLVGQRRAAEMLLLGEPFDAETAEACGLVNRVLDPEDVEAHALEQTQKLARQAPAALKLTKLLMRRATQDTVLSTMAVEGEHFMHQLQGPEAQEALTAFMQRRPPDFSSF